jgi:hypothetical protein
MRTNLKKSVLSIALVAMALSFTPNLKATAAVNNGSDTTKMAKKKMDKMDKMKKEDKMKMDDKMSKDKKKMDKMKMKKDSSKMKM